MRVSMMTSQRTRSWNASRRQLAKGDFGICGRYIFFYVVARRKPTEVDFDVREIYIYIYIYILNKYLVGIIGNSMIKL